MKNSIIYIAGPDGSGKTTILKEIEDEIISKGDLTKHIWIRSPKIFSKPLMAYCRLVGLTKYKTIDDVRYGGHDFYKSKFVSWVFPYLQLIDFKIKWYLEKKNIKAGEVLLFDRFCLDTLADLMVDTHRFNLHKTKVGKSFIKYLPNETKVIILYVNEETIRQRKKDTLHDDYLEMKIKVYNILSEDLNIKIIDNNRAFSEVQCDINNYLKNE